MGEDERRLRDELATIERLVEEWKGASGEEASWVACELHQFIARHVATLRRLLA